jgi:hypothetical protein
MGHAHRHRWHDTGRGFLQLETPELPQCILDRNKITDGDVRTKPLDTRKRGLSGTNLNVGR